MPSFKTIYRTIVMVALVGIAIKGWQLYGPPADQMRAIGIQAVELVSRTWSDMRRPGSAAGAQARGPQSEAPAFGQATAAPVNQQASVGNAGAAVAPSLIPAPPTSSVSASGLPAAVPSLLPAAKSELTPITPVEGAAKGDDKLQSLYARLEQLGVQDPQLKPWGSGGQLYRFCCRASLADSADYTRHFESVASEPLAAVQEVVTEVDAWRTAERDTLRR